MDCFEGMKPIPDHSIDLILTDPPYDKTQNKWDYAIDIELFWKNCIRVLKKRGCIVLTTVQPFTSKLIFSNPSMFRYELIWEKNRGSDFLNANVKPINAHENILIFYNKSPAYNPQRTQSQPYKKVKPKSKTFRNYNPHTRVPTESKDGSRFPTSVIKFARVENNVHPTQKPLKLFEWLIKTYSNEGDLILDPYLGSGTTAVACLRLQRNFIAFELERNYCKIAEERIRPFTAEQKRLNFQEAT